MEWETRIKPTRHVQSCVICKKDMKKDERQTIKRDWAMNGYEFRDYYCPECAITVSLSLDSFQKWFENNHGQMNLDNFMDAYESHSWINSYNDHQAPFRILASFHLTEEEEKKTMEEMFTLMIFNKAILPKEKEWV